MIRLTNVALKYDTGPEILSNIDFHLRPGSFHFLTGPSGAGKSTLLRLLFMSIHPTRGQIQMFSQDVSWISTAKRAQLRRRIGIVFQDFRLLDHLTTWENVALPLRVVGKDIEDYREDVTDLLQWVGLGDRMHAFPSVLSGGEKQRAAIARAVIGKPELLLADEPTGNVDPQMGRRLLRL
ncbi:MAG: cell division ATP-binding protein FtsE, partial [Gammaproteobacteria bacterium]